MGFIMSSAAKKYFDKLDEESTYGKFKAQFEFYYLCLIAGFMDEKFSDCKGEEFIKEFPGIFRMQREQIIGLLIATEISRNKIDINNRQRIEELMLKIVKPDSQTHLSDYGEKLMNGYAEHGFKLISEEIPSPHSLDTFLILYYENVLSKKKK